jgi:sulfopyruvate decarboxylase subunit beta
VINPLMRVKKTSLAAVASACGCENVIECQADEAVDVVEAAIASKKMTIIICKCISGNIPVPVITLDPVVIRHRFMQAVEA